MTLPTEQQIIERTWREVLAFLRAQGWTEGAPSISLIASEVEKRFPRRLRAVKLKNRWYRYDPTKKVFELTSSSDPLEARWVKSGELACIHEHGWQAWQLRDVADLMDRPYVDD